MSDDSPSGLMPITKETMEGAQGINTPFLIQSAIWNCGSYAADPKYILMVRHYESMVVGLLMDKDERVKYKAERDAKEVELKGQGFTGDKLFFELAEWKFERLMERVAKAKADERPDELE